MKKTMKGFGVLTAAVLMFAFAGQAGAFCVTNMSDKKIDVEQTKNGSFWLPKRFKARIDPTDKACCHWQTNDCNKSGGQTDRVAFDVNVVDFPAMPEVCDDYYIPANGDLYIYKKNDGYVCGDTLPPMPFPPPPPPPPPFPGQ